MTSLIMNIGVLTANIPNQYPHVKAGRGTRGSMKFPIRACRMDQWNIRSMAKCAHCAVKQTLTRSIY